MMLGLKMISEVLMMLGRECLPQMLTVPGMQRFVATWIILFAPQGCRLVKKFERAETMEHPSKQVWSQKEMRTIVSRAGAIFAISLVLAFGSFELR